MDIFVDRQSPIPPYLQIKNKIKELIDSGEWKENQTIESVRSIAQMAGVSLATAQKAFYELKQENIIYPKAGCGYFVTPRSSMTNNVFVFLPCSRLTFFTYILNGMYEANRSFNLNIQVYSLDTDKLAWNEQTAELLRVARSQKCSVIFIEEAFGEMRRECFKTAQKVPFVAIEWVLENAVSIVNDYRIAGYKMIEYCVKKRNAKSIMVLKGREHQYNAYERLIGMRQAMKDFNLTEDKDVCFFDTDFDAISAYETIKKYYNEESKKDALICANDYEAMGAIGAFVEKRILVGKDVILIGFGNMIDSVTSYIPITTMDQQLRLIGIRAITCIAELLKDNKAEKREKIITIPVKLVERMT